MPEKKAILALADGTVFRGTAFGYEGECGGEVVFNTGMTGYEEVLTDPSYKGQIVTMTYPEIGNTGINPDDVESTRPWVEGFIVREAWRLPSNWRHVESLDGYLRRYRVCGISRIVAIDYGIKQNILRMMVSHGFDVTVVPAAATAERILAGNPDGVFLSNGPGDPEGVPYAVDTVRGLLGK